MTKFWKPINDSVATWRMADASSLAAIKPSWDRRRATLVDQFAEGFAAFNQRLMREHAIETGVIERLYELKRGVTETLIKEGFNGSIITHGDTNISTDQLMKVLDDQYNALDFAFGFIQDERPLSQKFIRELHQIVTKNQQEIEVDVLVNNERRLQMTNLLKGEYKKHANNPRRSDGVIVEYCPPDQVQYEMDNLVHIHNQLWEDKVPTAIIAAWMHHAFAMIHPFQDGNGRVARILTSLILIKDNLFPFTVNRDQKTAYINALEKADDGIVQPFVSFVCDQQRSIIDEALNFDPTTISGTRDVSLASNQANRLAGLLQRKHQSKVELAAINIQNTRVALFDQVYEAVNHRVEGFKQTFQATDLSLNQFNMGFGLDKSHYYAFQIVELAKAHNYFFRKNDPRAWIKVEIWMSGVKYAELIFSLHHFGYEASAIKLGAFIEWHQTETTEEQTKQPAKQNEDQLQTVGNGD